MTSVSTRDSRLLKERFKLSFPSIINLVLVLSWRSANEKHKFKGFLSISYL